MKRSLLLASLTTLGCMLGYQPAAAQTPARSGPAASAQAERALLDRYCVTWGDDEQKTGELWLQKLELSTVKDHPELWEKVVHRLRAVQMPPAGMKRPPLPEYEGLRDWLETEIDRKAATRSNSGSVILHRLNRTEYANAIRDLLDLDRNVAAASATRRGARTSTTSPVR